MIVGEHSNSQRNPNRSNLDCRADRDKEKDYRYERDREYRSDRNRERDRDRIGGSERGSNNRSGQDRRSQSRDRERSGRNTNSFRGYDRGRGRSPPVGATSCENDGKRYNGNRSSPVNQDAMSGLTALENLRDRGVSRSPIRSVAPGNDKLGGEGGSFNLMSSEMQVKLKFTKLSLRATM